MRILYIITKSEAGGAQTHIAQLSRALIARGDSVVVMSAPGGWLEKEIISLGGTFIAVPQFSNSYNILRLFSIQKVVDTALCDWKPDIVSCHSGFAGFMGRLAVRNRAPVIFTAHGWSFSPGAPFFQRVASLTAEVLAAPLCRKIVCVSHYDRIIALGTHLIPKTKLVVIRNGAEVPSGEISPRRALRRIVYVGRLASPKRPIELLEALQLLSETVRDEIAVDIAGDGPDRAMLESYAKTNGLSNMHFLGEQSREQIFALLDRSDLMVLPTQKEGLPRSIIEALIHGVPVAATNVGGVSELVTKDTGFLLPLEDGGKSLAEIIELLHADPERFQRLSVQSAAYARKNFSLERVLSETFALYDVVLSKKN